MKFLEVKQYLQEKKLDAIVLFSNHPAFKYFTRGGFEHGIMFLTKKNNYLFLSRLYNPRIEGFRVIHWRSFEKDFKSFIRKHNLRRIGVDTPELLVRQKSFLRKYFKIKKTSSFLQNLRISKTKEEVSRIRKACNITNTIFYEIINNFKFRREADILRFIKIKALELADGTAFEPIVANARNAVIAHHEPHSRLRKGFLILDFGVNYKGYLSDMTRTVYLGTPSKKEKRIYEKIRSIQEACIEKAEPGLRADKLYDYSLSLFGSDKNHFLHGLGHGIGVEIHEKPSLSPESKDVLVKGSVFTIEPGYYNNKTGVGIRIEDDIYLGTKKKVLTKPTKELICLQPSYL